MSILASLLVVASLQTTDPNQLPIGPKGSVQVQPGSIVETKTGKVVSVEEVVRACGKSELLFLGENHATRPHQALQAELIAELVRQGRTPSVGLEMFTRPKQDVLDLWSAGSLTEAEFLEKSEWKTQWGYGYEFYKPVFDVAKLNKLPLVALNVPRDWVRTAGRGGLGKLPTSAKMQLPTQFDLGNKNHRSVFESLMGGHQMAGPSMDNMYSAQVLWDEGMADSAIKYLGLKPKAASDVLVVVAGSGHIMYGQGINYRMAKRGFRNGKNLVMVQSDKPVTVSKGLGDFVFVSVPTPAAAK